MGDAHPLRGEPYPKRVETYTGMIAEAEWLYAYLSGEDGAMDKQELVAAHGGDFRIFQAPTFSHCST